MLKKISSFALSLSLLASFSFANDKIMGQELPPMPVYKEWAKLYYKDTKNQVTYSGGGSGKGVSAITDRNGDFGGTIAALKR